MIKAAYTKLTTRKPAYFAAEKAEKIEHYIMNVTDLEDVPGLPKVIVHGDMWCGNMVFQKGEGES